jgi:hypothetical protein
MGLGTCSLLGSHGRGGSDDHALSDSGRSAAERCRSETEVRDDDPLAPRMGNQQNVFAFKISMNDAGGMNGFHSRKDPANDGSSRFHRQRFPATNSAAQRFTSEKFHHEEWDGFGWPPSDPALMRAHVEYATHVRVNHLPREARFDGNPVNRPSVVECGARKGFDGDPIAQTQVARNVDLSHPAGGEEPIDAVPIPDGFAGRECPQGECVAAVRSERAARLRKLIAAASTGFKVPRQASVVKVFVACDERQDSSSEGQVSLAVTFALMPSGTVTAVVADHGTCDCLS